MKPTTPGGGPRDYRQYLRPMFRRWPFWALKVLVVVVTAPALLYGAGLGAWDGIREAANELREHWRNLWRP